MNRTVTRTMRKLMTAAALGTGLFVLPSFAEAVNVDCSRPTGKIQPRLNTTAKTVLIVVKGTCVENVVITRDDVTITTDGVNPASIVAADPSQPAIQLDGAHRIVLDGKASGLTISGGTFGVGVTRGSTLDLSNCVVTGNSVNGVVAAYGSTLSVDGCVIGPNAGIGVVAAQAASVAVTDTTVSGNTGGGILATRGAYVRVGQDLRGTTTLQPVAVSGNGGNGIAITESSAGNVLGTTIETSAASNLFVGRGSSGQIGSGSNGLTGAVAVQNGSGHGVAIEGGNATILFATVTGNALTGVIVSNAGSARIGIFNGNTGLAPTTISNNGQVGLHVAIGAAAFVGGTTISGNGTAAGSFGRYGIGVFAATVTLASGNTISGNGETGIFVGRGGTLHVGDAAFGLGTANTISGNGTTGPNTGGVFAFQGGAAQLTDATIADNVGAALQAFEGGIFEVRGTTAVTVPASGTTAGATVSFGSTLRLRDTASIRSATSDGIQASNLSALNISGTSVVQGNGGGAVGIRCSAVAPMTASAVALTGNLAGVSGTTGATAGTCNVFQ